MFKLTAPASLFSTVVANNLTQLLGIESGVVTLFKETGAVDTPLGNVAVSGASRSISHSFGSVARGDYHHLVSGKGNGSLGGVYTIGSAVAAVPEPETYALMLGGLGVSGFLARLRRA